MKLSQSFYQTMKEVPREAQIPSHQLMFRTGMIQQLASGIYNYLPMALKSLKKIETIIREELDKRGCQEVLLPVVQPAELWQESGRWGYYGPELLRLKDRKEGDYCLGPTHEEVITDLVRRNLKSYKQLPWNLYQIQGKFRDEIRPRFGLMRGREFIMKDAYSFDTDIDASMKNYQLMYEAYEAIFKRCGLEFRAVEAATGNIGGDKSHEFQVLAATGEDEILSCNQCKYAANKEKARTKRERKSLNEADFKVIEEVHTPDKKTIEEVATFLNVSEEETIKSVIYMADEEPVIVFIQGNLDVNDSKLQSLLGVNSLEMASDEVVKDISGASPGSVGPVSLKKKVKIVCDYSVYDRPNRVAGANKDDYHLKNVCPGRDFEADVVGDILFAMDGEECPECDGTLESHRGIEVGQVFYLGTKYSKPMNCNYLDSNGKEHPAVMGCYGIGVGRTMAAAIEQNHDDDGIIWPFAIAPYEIVILPLQMNNEDVVAAGEKLYEECKTAGFDVILDDRSERAGFKFKDADLIGYPVQLVIGGRSLEKGVYELKLRKKGEKQEIPVDSVIDFLNEFKAKELNL